MKDQLTGPKLEAQVKVISDKTLLQYETRIGHRLSGMQKCIPWPALIASVAADLEIVWAEMKKRHDKR